MSLRRQLGFWDVFCIASGAMISSGLFVLPGMAFGLAGPAVIVSYALAALLVVPALLCQAELASALPRTGATYVFIERSLGGFPGLFAGMASWFSIALKSSFALIGIGAFVQLIRPGTPLWVVKATALAFCLAFTTLNCLTIKGVGRAQIMMVAVLLAALVAFVLGAKASGEMQLDHLRGFYRAGGWQIAAVAGLVFVSFGGLTATADIAGEVRKPGRNVPAGMLAALVVVGLLYVVCVASIVLVTPGDELAGSLTPVSLAAGRFWGTAGVIVLSLAAALAFVTTANGGILEASRSPVAMSADNLLPAWFQRVHPRFGTPVVSVLATGGMMAASIALLDIGDLVKVASTMLLILYVLICLSVLVMRFAKVQNYRPAFTSPLFPYMPGVGVVAYVALIVDMGPVPLIATGAFAALGLIWYFLYVRPRSDRQSALVSMVRTALAKEMRSDGLESELREVVLERDERGEDRFDRFIKTGPVLDVDRSVTADELFRAAADLLAEPLGVAAPRLLDALRVREAESHTVIQPGIAIPHVIVPGHGRFAVLPVRCREGIRFEGDPEPVVVAFVLGGSADMRNVHLRALVAVANLVQEPGFAQRWRDATDAERLRDVLLLGSRQRH